MNKNKHIFFCHFFFRLSRSQTLGVKDKYIQYIQGALQPKTAQIISICWAMSSNKCMYTFGAKGLGRDKDKNAV